MLPPDEALKSLREIQDLTGFSFKRIKQKIGGLKPEKISGSIHYYDTRKLIPLLFEAKKNMEGLELDQERARLASAQADRTEIIVQQMKRELIPVDEIEFALNKIFASLRARCLALPSKIAPQLVGLNPQEIEFTLKESIHELLTELSTFDIEAIINTESAQMPKDHSTSSEIHGLDLV